MTIPAAATAPAAPVPATLDPEGRIARQRGPWLRVVPEPRLALVIALLSPLWLVPGSLGRVPASSSSSRSRQRLSA